MPRQQVHSGAGPITLARGISQGQQELRIRLTAEQVAHILEHRGMKELKSALAETLPCPEHVVASCSDPQARLSDRRCHGVGLRGKKFVSVLKVAEDHAFVLSAYLTKRVAEKVLLWPKNR
jgi:hypothetical protein